MAASFTPTGSYSNLTRLELEQLRKADFFAGSKALTVGDSALPPEGVVGKGDINAEPYLTGPNVLLDDVYSQTPPTQPGKYIGTLTQTSDLTADTAKWYGPTHIVSGTQGAGTAVNQFTDSTASFIVAGVQAGDLLLVRNGPTSSANANLVGTISVVGATTLTCTNIHRVSAPTNQFNVAADLYPYVIVRPLAVQLFAVPGSGPTGQEQTFLAVIPGSTLHSNVAPTVDQINADRVKSLVPSAYGLDSTVDRADSVFDAPAPRTSLDKLGYRVVLYPDNGLGTGPDLTQPITSLNPVIDPAIAPGDQRLTIDYKAGVIRFSCAPKIGGNIKVVGGVNGVTGRLNLYAVFWAVDSTLTKGSARLLYATRGTDIVASAGSKLYFDGIGWSTGTFSPTTQNGSSIGSDDILAFYDAQTVANAGNNGGKFMRFSSTTTADGAKIVRIFDKGWGQFTTTIAAGSNGVSLPTGTINVASTAKFPATGSLIVNTSAGPQFVTYTGTTSTTFTGCTGGTGTMSTGGSVVPVAEQLLKNLNGRFYCSIGDGTNSFGDFNGTNAINAAMACIQSAGLNINSATIFLKRGFHSMNATINLGAFGPGFLTIEGYGSGQGGSGSTLSAPAAAIDSMYVHSGNTLYLKGIHVISNGAAGVYSVRASDSGRVIAQDCSFDNVILSSLSGDDAPSVFTRCLFDGTANDAAITIEGGGTTDCKRVFVDECSFSMGFTVPAIRIRALAGAIGTIEGIHVSRSKFVLNQTTTATPGGFTNGVLAQNTGIVDLDPNAQDARTGNGATIQDVVFENCIISTPNPNVPSGFVNVILHLTPSGNGVNGAGVGPYLQVQHFVIRNSRIICQLGDPIPPNQLTPFNVAQGAKHFELNDVVFTMVPTAAQPGCLIPDDTAFWYTGGGAPPSVFFYGTVNILADKVTAKKIKGTGFKQLSTAGDISIRTQDIDVDDLQLSSFSDGGTGSTPIHRLLFSGYGNGFHSGGRIRNIQMDGQTAGGGAWAVDSIICMLNWESNDNRHVVFSGGRVHGFLNGGGAVGGYYALFLNAVSGNIIGVEIEDLAGSSLRGGILASTSLNISGLYIRRCRFYSLGSGGLGRGIWVSGHIIDEDGITIEQNVIRSCTQEGILVETDNAGGESWLGCVWLLNNTAAGNNGAAANVQIKIDCHTISRVGGIVSVAMNNNTDLLGTLGQMQVSGTGAFVSPNANLTYNLRGWQTVGAGADTRLYANGGTMLFNTAIFAT
jgi:hypothetical protein